jgi:hypothetical protein
MNINAISVVLVAVVFWGSLVHAQVPQYESMLYRAHLFDTTNHPVQGDTLTIWWVVWVAVDACRHWLLGTVDSLGDLYYATNGSNWHRSTNWLQHDPCLNSWFGVLCDDTNSTVLKLYAMCRWWCIRV